MLNMIYYFSLYMFFISCLMFSYYYKHLILVLISLEFMVVFMLYNMFLLMQVFQLVNLIMFIMVMTVCEGALSLTLLILIVRLNGNDYLNSLMILKW